MDGWMDGWIMQKEDAYEYCIVLYLCRGMKEKMRWYLYVLYYR
jgi:hypothetical protein